MNPDYIYWEDLSPAEKEQATETYICIRECEEQRSRDEVTNTYAELINPSNVECCKFIRQEDGYVIVDI